VDKVILRPRDTLLPCDRQNNSDSDGISSRRARGALTTCLQCSWSHRYMPIECTRSILFYGPSSEAPSLRSAFPRTTTSDSTTLAVSLPLLTTLLIDPPCSHYRVSSLRERPRNNCHLCRSCCLGGVPRKSRPTCSRWSRTTH